MPDAPFDTSHPSVSAHRKSKVEGDHDCTCLLTTSSCRATEMDITMIGLQNAGKTSLLRVLAVSPFLIRT
jgi:GTPase SAR1 family protein